MKKSTALPRIIALMAAAAMIAFFFMPYVTLTDSAKQTMASYRTNTASENLNMTYGDIEELSLYEYTRIYLLDKGENMQQYAETFYAVLLIVFGSCAVLSALAALRGRATPLILLGAAIAGINRILIWDFEDRGIISGYRIFTSLPQYYYIAAGVMLIAGVILFAVKHHNKRLSRI